MATAPSVPNFPQTNFALGDTAAAVDKQNAQNAMLVDYFGRFAAFAQQLATEQQQTLNSADQILQSTNSVYQNVVQERQAAQAAREEAEAARNQAQQIAVGDVNVTDLQPGAMTAALDYVSTDGKVLTVRNFATDFATQLANANKPAKLTRYDLAAAAVTQTLDLAQRQVFRIDASVQRTLTLANAPGADRAMFVVIKLTGSMSPNWPAEWQDAWIEGAEPLLGTTKTTVVGWWDGDEWELSVRSTQ